MNNRTLSYIPILAAFLLQAISAQESRTVLEKKRTVEEAAAFLVSDVRVLESTKAETETAQQELAALMAEKISLGVELRSLLSMQVQGAAREAALNAEVSTIQQSLQENIVGLHDRYFADPSHLRRAHSSIIIADTAFREAQRWMFFTIRALEYKWNKPFEIGEFDIESVFQARNMDELLAIKNQADVFNTVNSTTASNLLLHRISLRDDLLAPFAGPGQDDGTRMDAETGEVVSASELVRRKLDRTRDEFGNVVVRFNTFTLKKDGFFSGAEFNPNGSLRTGGRYLDKIDWIKVNVVGTHAPALKTADFSYGGTSYIRTQQPVCAIPATAGGAIPDEVTPYPVRFFFTADNGVTWESRPKVVGTINVMFTNASWRDLTGQINIPNDPSIQFREFRQRSVAAVDWRLTITSDRIDIGKLDDIEFWISHRDVGRLPCK